MNRIYCLACGKFYLKEKTGFTVKVTNDGRNFIRGDLYRCSGCDHTVYGDFGEPFEARPNVESGLKEIDQVMRKAGRRLVEK